MRIPLRSKNPIPASFWSAAYRLTTNESWPPTTAAGARSMIEGCSRHGLLPLLLAETDLPPALEQARSEASGMRRFLDLLARGIRDALLELCDLLAGEPIALLKGSDYAQRLYPSGFLRPMRDLDVLVPADRMDPVCHRLVDGGLVFRQHSGPAALDPAHHERVFSLGHVFVDVHQSFIQRPRHQVDYEGIWRRRVPLEIDGRRVSRLDDVDALVYHTLSMAIDEFRSPFVRYVDLWLLLGQREGIAVAAAERAREWQTARAFYGALSLACRLFPEFRTDDVRAAMARVAPASTRLFVDNCVLPRLSEIGAEARGRHSRLLQLWRKAFLMDTPRRRAAFALSHAAATIRGLRPGPKALPEPRLH